MAIISRARERENEREKGKEHASSFSLCVHHQSLLYLIHSPVQLSAGVFVQIKRLESFGERANLSGDLARCDLRVGPVTLRAHNHTQLGIKAATSNRFRTLRRRMIVMMMWMMMMMRRRRSRRSRREREREKRQKRERQAVRGREGLRSVTLRAHNHIQLGIEAATSNRFKTLKERREKKKAE